MDEGYDIYHPQDDQIHKIAKDFEQFLIVAGNLEEIHTEMSRNDALYDEKKRDFLNRLKELNVSEDYHKAWLRVL